MTLYSTSGTGRMRLVDGSLSTDDELAQEQLAQMVECVTSGAIRALLDSATDESDRDANVYAEQWHCEREGWEQEAVVADDLPALVAVTTRFVHENTQRILDLANRIGWDPGFRSDPMVSDNTWGGDLGMAIYRVGNLLGFTLAGQGIGFSDYYAPLLIDGKLPERPSDSIVDPLLAWVAGLNVWFEETWIDSTEEPCRLHLS